MNVDPRFLRSQERLYAAILGLAAEQRLDTITVTQLAQVAGVHRSTVYEHAESIEQLLRNAITSELDRLYREHGTLDRPGTTSHDALFAILGYIELHEALYRRMADASGAVIAEALSSHTADILLNLSAKNIVTTPPNRTKLDDNTVHAIATRALSDALVRVFSQWLALPAPRDMSVAVELVTLVIPAWWQGQSDSAS